MESPTRVDDQLEPSQDSESGINPALSPHSWSIRRILVAMDASPNSRTALDTAIELAETFNSEIRGLFVEDVNLLRLAELPFAREILYAHATSLRLESEVLQRKLRARAAILKRQLEESTSEHKVPGSFFVSRGPINEEILTAALETDLLALGRLGHSIIGRARLGSTARAILNRATSAVLLVKSEVEAGPIIALYDGSEVGQRILNLSAAIAKGSEDLRVLVWASNEEGAFERRQLAAHILEKFPLQIQFQHLSGDNPQRMLQWINRQKARLLILGAGETNLPSDIYQLLLDEAEQHILVIK